MPVGEIETILRKKKYEVKRGCVATELSLASPVLGVSTSRGSFLNFHCMNYPSFPPRNPMLSKTSMIFK